MKQKMLRGFLAGLVGLATATAAVNGGGQPGSAASCLRSVAIDPQVTVSESIRALTFEVHTNSCAQAGSVSYMVVDGTAQRPGDYMLENGVLTWTLGDLSSRRITASIANDQLRESLLENFTVVLFNPTGDVRISQAKGQARIFDDDGQGRSTTIDDSICLISGGEKCQPSPSGSTGMAPFSGPIGTQTFEPGHLLIALNQSNPGFQSVHVQTFDDGLVGGTDYVPVSRNIVIPPNAFFVIVEVMLMPHAFTQPGESFTVQISGYTAGGTADPSATYTMVG